MDYPSFFYRRHSVQESFTTWPPRESPDNRLRRPHASPNHSFPIPNDSQHYPSTFYPQEPSSYPSSPPLAANGGASFSTSTAQPPGPSYAFPSPHVAQPSTSSTSSNPAESQGTSGAERRVRKRDEGCLRRPPNAFILYRSEQVRLFKRDGSPKKLQSDASKLIGGMWRSIPVEERRVWEDKANAVKAQHLADHPDYRYKPLRKGKQAAEPHPPPRTSSPLSPRRSEVDSHAYGSEHKTSELLPPLPKHLLSRSTTAHINIPPSSPTFLPSDLEPPSRQVRRRSYPPLRQPTQPFSSFSDTIERPHANERHYFVPLAPPAPRSFFPQPPPPHFPPSSSPPSLSHPTVPFTDSTFSHFYAPRTIHNVAPAYLEEYWPPQEQGYTPMYQPALVGWNGEYRELEQTVQFAAFDPWTEGGSGASSHPFQP